MPRRQPRPNWPGHATLADAIRYLASACDGARRRDHHGFNAEHAAVGHRLARTPDQLWTPWHVQAARQLVIVYQHQLSAAGFNPRAVYRGVPPRLAKRRELRALHPRWAPDPTGLWHSRWWNGARWTHHTT